MAILTLSLLKALSYKGARDLLLQEGYVEEKYYKEQGTSCDKKVLYPYVLYDSKKRKLDCIYYVEYCNWVIDDEYIDGRMTWEDIKTEWTRND